MPKFLVIQKEPQEYKQQILQFWREYLPETPPGRFEWMNCGNPAGPTIWFFAFEGNSTELAGTISIMPRELSLKGHTMRAGILGDYMVNSKYRVFGPALQILKTVIANLSPLNFNLFYTIPNHDSQKMIQRAGFTQSKVLYHLSKPINVCYYLEKYMSPFLARLLAPSIAQGFRLCSRETFSSTKGMVMETAKSDESFDLLWNKIKINQSGIVGDLSSAYLNWRYFKNPLYKFRVLTYRIHPQGELLGYIFFTINDSRLEIYDLASLHRNYVYILLKKLAHIARVEKCIAIYSRILETNPWLNTLKACNFFNTKDDARVFFQGQELHGKEWYFFSGERNI